MYNFNSTADPLLFVLSAYGAAFVFVGMVALVVRATK